MCHNCNIVTRRLHVVILLLTFVKTFFPCFSVFEEIYLDLSPGSNFVFVIFVYMQ